MGEVASLSLQKVRLDSIRLGDCNPKQHDIEAIVRSIEKYGFRCPLVVNEDGYLEHGYGRYEALRRLGVEEAWAVIVHDDEARQLAYQLDANLTHDLVPGVDMDRALLSGYKFDDMLEMLRRTRQAGDLGVFASVLSDWERELRLAQDEVGVKESEALVLEGTLVCWRFRLSPELGERWDRWKERVSVTDDVEAFYRMVELVYEAAAREGMAGQEAGA